MSCWTMCKSPNGKCSTRKDSINFLSMTFRVDHFPFGDLHIVLHDIVDHFPGRPLSESTTFRVDHFPGRSLSTVRSFHSSWFSLKENVLKDEKYLSNLQPSQRRYFRIFSGPIKRANFISSFSSLFFLFFSMEKLL